MNKYADFLLKIKMKLYRGGHFVMMVQKRGLIILLVLALIGLLTFEFVREINSVFIPKNKVQDKQITLTVYHWIGTDSGVVVDEINKRFHEKYPNITIKYENVPTDLYNSDLLTSLASGNAPDIFGVFPGENMNQLVKAGYLMDLSDQAWVANLMDEPKSVATENDKVYALPMDQNVLGVIYNKEIFSKLGLPIPKTWEQFLYVCQKIKKMGIIPIALGGKDLWVGQLIPYTMAPSAIYSKNPNFDQLMMIGKTQFSNSPWNQMMKDYIALERNGDFNTNLLNTTYDQTTQLVADEKAAMVVNGNWTLGTIEELNPDIQLGMFPLPYSQNSKQIRVSAAVGTMMGISATTKHPVEAKEYLDFWARPDIIKLFLDSEQAFSTYKNVNVHLDPAAEEMEPALKQGSYNFLDQKWPPGVQDVMQKDIQFVLSGDYTINKMLKDMDQAYKSGKTKSLNK